MRPFRLEYKGPLHSAQAKKSDRLREIHDIRRAFHSQLKRPWKSTELLRFKSQAEFWGILAVKRGGFDDMGHHVDPDWATTKRTKNGHDINFIPLVIRQRNIALTCELRIHIGWREKAPGGILRSTPEGFDLDNRLKGLMDALTTPQDGQLPHDVSADPSPYFLTLLEDDGLVTRIDIKADPLGLPERLDEQDGYLEIAIEVKVDGDALDDF